MAVHPIDYRYFTEEMHALFEEDNILQRKLDVETALAKVHAKLGNIPKDAAVEIEKKSSTKYVTMKRVQEIDDEIHHDLMAIVKALSEKCVGDAGKYVHYGATSYDIVDSAYSTLLRDALLLVRRDVEKFKQLLLEKAEKYKSLVMIGRTHGQHAVPITLGLKFSVWASEVQRHLDRIDQVLPVVAVGKMSGAVGTGAALGKKAFKIQESTELIRREIERLVSHLAKYETFMAKVGKNLGLTVSSYNTAYKEFAKIDKDVLKITGGAMGVEPLTIDRPQHIEEVD